MTANSAAQPTPDSDDAADLTWDERPAAIDELRVVIECDDWDVAVAFYQKALGLKVAAGYASGDQGQLLLEVGSAFIELVHPELTVPGTESPTELAAPPAPKIRLSFRSHDPLDTVAKMEAAGAERVTGPELTSSNSLTARLVAPDRLPVSVFESYDKAGFSEATSEPFDLPQQPDADYNSRSSKPDDDLYSLIYSSKAVNELTDTDILELLTVSRRNNAELGLTGVLLFRNGRFMQYLEGPKPELVERIRIIAGDSRHTSFTTLREGPVATRTFPAWSMGFEKLSDATAATIPGYRESLGDLAESLGGTENEGNLERLEAWFSRHASGAQL